MDVRGLELQPGVRDVAHQQAVAFQIGANALSILLETPANAPPKKELSLKITA